MKFIIHRLNNIPKHQEYQCFIKWTHYSSFDILMKRIATLMKFKNIFFYLFNLFSVEN